MQIFVMYNKGDQMLGVVTINNVIYVMDIVLIIYVYQLVMLFLLRLNNFRLFINDSDNIAKTMLDYSTHV